MHQFWESIIEPALSILKPKTIVEVGAAQGENTRKILEYCLANRARLHVIDPQPQLDVEEWKREHKDRLVFHRALSLEVLSQLDRFEVIFIDGDHNWYTVHHELLMIAETCQRLKQPFPILFFHDVGWPYGRRDVYYHPDQVPPQYRKPHKKSGILPGKSQLSESTGINRNIDNAMSEGGPQNGVLTAIEDFQKKSSQEFVLHVVPGLFGLGILAPADLLDQKPELQQFLQALELSPAISGHIEAVEADRIAHLIELQKREADRQYAKDKLASFKQEAARQSERQRKEQARLEKELARASRDRETMIQQVEQLKSHFRKVTTSASFRLSCKLDQVAKHLAGKPALSKFLVQLQDGFEQFEQTKQFSRSDVPLPPGSAIERAVVNDAMGFVEQYDYNGEDLACNRQLLEEFAKEPPAAPQSLNWFVPQFDHVLRGGIRTIISFADTFRREKGVANRVVVYGARKATPETFHREILKAFPDFPKEDVFVYDGGDPDTLPESDGDIATLWTSAYHVLKHRQTRSKFYLVQDFEPLFYPAGTVYGLILATYRFGFWGIANTPGVGEAYRAVSGAPTQAFVPAVDTSVYNPLPPGEPKHKPGEPKWVVFYGRPGKRRNCFELGVLSLIRLKEKLGDGVRIVSVGSSWDPAEYGAEGQIENLGLLNSLQELADLYRHCDAGLCFMQTPHPSYQPLEYMACGCPTVTNNNPANTWLLKDGENCMLAEPTVSGVTEALVRVLKDESLSKRIVSNGLESVKGNDWKKQMDLVFDFLCKHSPAAQGK